MDVWPGYVDALSTLLMVITFVLLVFVLAQAFLSVSLSNKDFELQTLTRQIQQLTDLLSLEKGRSAELNLAVSQLNRDVRSAEAGRDVARRQLEQAQASARTAAGAEAALKDQNAGLAARLSDAQGEAESVAARLQAAQGQVSAQTDAADRLAHDDAQIVLLNKQLEELRRQLAEISAALDLSKGREVAQAAQIGDLTARLNVALAAKVEELQRYRSEFFGRLREVLAGRAGITVVGDRFVFQSEVLFPVGSAEMSAAGQGQIKALAGTLLEIAKKIPPALPWILRVDGHADRQKLSGTGKFSSNWELSAQRAINVVEYLIAQGVPPTHLAATAFADNQPLTAGTAPADYARDRRIELRLTDR